MKNVSMIKNIVFDFGAVLVDWNRHYLYDDVFDSYDKAQWFIDNIVNDEWNIKMDGGKPFKENIAELVALHPEWKKEIELYDPGWWRMMGKTLPGMKDLLHTLKSKGYPLYGLTNWSAEKFPMVRSTYQIFSLLDGIVVSGEEKLLKPDPAIYKVLLDRYFLNPSETIFIDDNIKNVEGARNVGMQAYHFKSPEALYDYFKEIGIL